MIIECSSVGTVMLPIEKIKSVHPSARILKRVPMSVKPLNTQNLSIKGTKAPQAAGKIHSDFEKGFIRAEVIKYEDYISYGSESAVKEAGKMSVEGKEYIVQDGDIMHFLFNV